MLSNFSLTILSAAGLLSFASAGEGRHIALNLLEFQQVLRTGLDSELVKIIDEYRKSEAIDTDQRMIHIKKSNVRRRRTGQDNTGIRDDDLHLNSNPSLTAEHVEDITKHAWNKAKTIERGVHGVLSVTERPQEAHPCPFLVCTHGRKQQDEGNSVQNIIALFDKKYGQSLVVSSSQEETCLILTTTAHKAQQVMDSHEGTQYLAVVPLPDLSKIHYGTIEEVSSKGWTVPFHEQQGQSPDKESSTKK
ncbi:hypothetical protein ACHAW5_003733 [Stephanodiscus triporus]|uniref:Uncharacterized protein n=1 Tax=Stephanodiscus triporus TaxID=2934178 RepID=A0ABD3Q2P7_9STRA